MTSYVVLIIIALAGCMSISKKEPNQVINKTKFDHVSGRYISCGDAKIYIEEKGNADSPILLMLHGGFGNIEDFNTITSALSQKFRIIGIDSRGHGKSSLGAKPLSYKLLANDLAHIINSLELKEFNILGFSDGGITAYRYAARQDSRLRKIVTVGARWEMSKNDPAYGMLSGMTGDTWKEMFPSSYESYIHLNPEPDFDRFSIAVVSMWIDLSPEGHPEKLMNQITNEILVVRGDKDPLTSLESMVKLRGIVKNMSFLNIPLAEHVAFNDAPEIFLQEVDRFFGRRVDDPCCL
jgi:pimeloyl-ACP methyl ester carboxylesterase